MSYHPHVECNSGIGYTLLSTPGRESGGIPSKSRHNGTSFLLSGLIAVNLVKTGCFRAKGIRPRRFATLPGSSVVVDQPLAPHQCVQGSLDVLFLYAEMMRHFAG